MELVTLKLIRRTRAMHTVCKPCAKNGPPPSGQSPNADRRVREVTLNTCRPLGLRRGVRQLSSRLRAIIADVALSHHVKLRVIVIDFCLFLPAASSPASSSGSIFCH